jgi:hypothetical protein
MTRTVNYSTYQNLKNDKKICEEELKTAKQEYIERLNFDIKMGENDIKYNKNKDKQNSTRYWYSLLVVSLFWILILYKPDVLSGILAIIDLFLLYLLYKE